MKVVEIPQSQLRTPPQAGQKLSFGRIFSNRMFTMRHAQSKGWHDEQICKYENFSISPAAFVFHYGQEIFEGLKAYRWSDGSIALFRPRDNFLRMNRSAERMCLPQFDVDYVLNALLELLRLEKDWVPSDSGASLYIRPAMIAVDPYVGLHPTEESLFYIICSPVGAYLSGISSIMVETEYVRAVRGGIGTAKTGGNYAASLYPTKLAAEKGYDQVLWLDGVEQRYVEEVGSMNIFFIYGDRVVTSQLNGSILPGITRDSVLKVAKHWGLETVEGKLDINEIIADVEAGKITEVFGAGTAAVISPIGRLGYKGKDYTVGSGKSIGTLSQKFYDTITGIQYGRIPDEFGWIVKP